MRLVSKLTPTILFIGAAVFILAASAASAQVYPPDAEDLSVEASDSNPDPGDTVDVTARIVDSDGEGVADAEVEFTITSNPGDAEFENGEQSITETTDGDGFATVGLNTGGEPGTIVVRAEGAGQVSQVTVTTGDPQALPPTGGVPTVSGSDIPLTALAAFAAGASLLLAAGFGVWLAGTSTRRSPDRYSI